MNFSLSLDLVLYGLMLGGLSVVAHRAAPDFAGVTLATGLAGGTLTMLWPGS